MQAALHASLDHALRLCQAGEFEAAEQVYRDLTRSHPDAPDAWNMLAVVLCQQGDLEGATQASERATALRPQVAPYWLVRGNAELADRRHENACRSFLRALELEPAFAEAHYRLGLAYHALLRFGDAAVAYRAALQLAPDVAEIHWQLAQVLVTQGQLTEAMRAYHDAFARDPGEQLDRRPCFSWLARLHFDTLPPLFHAELERFFSRENVDTKPYVGAGLRALKTKRGFRSLLQNSQPAITFDAALEEALLDRLFSALLRECLIADPEFERFLTTLRSRLLSDGTFRAKVPFDFLCAFALQCFNNEYVYAQSEAEQAQVDALSAALEKDSRSSATGVDEWLRAFLVVACYRRPETIPGVDRILAEQRAGPAFARVLERSVIDVRKERSLRARIASIGGTDDDVSRAVRAMYEEHPYPRWFAVDRGEPFPLAEWLQRDLPVAPRMRAPDSVRVLVAGCGTGRDAIWIASNIAGSHVLAVDLSLTSLAYASRMAGKLGLTNIEFRQGDILRLSELEERFDLIASTGVLHHMRDPAAGLRSIARLLRPGGWMKLGFYSRRGRASVNAARHIISSEQMPATEPSIRAFRQRVFTAGADSPLKPLELSNDFYSMSMCRDLLFHVQEHQYTLPEIGGMLGEVDLEFVGLGELPEEAVGGYRGMFASDTGMTDIANWDDYEARHPDTFSRMFLVWCRAPDG